MSKCKQVMLKQSEIIALMQCVDDSLSNDPKAIKSAIDKLKRATQTPSPKKVKHCEELTANNAWFLSGEKE